MADDSLIIKIGAKTQSFDAALKKMQAETKALESHLSSIAKASGIAFAGLSATIVGTVTAFAKFDQQMRLVRTNLDDSSFGAKSLHQGFKEMTDQAIELGRTMPISFASTAGALFDTVSAGVAAGGAIKVVAAAGKLATAGLTDVSIATDGLTSALNSFHISADKADAVASKFYEAQLYGKTTVEELAGGLGQVSSTAANLGVSLNELLAATAAVTLGGKRTNETMTGLKSLLSNIAKPSADAAAEAQRLGVQFNATALRAKGLSGFLQSITSAQGFTKDSAVKLFGSIQALDLAFSLTGSQAKNFRDILAVLNNDQKTQAALNDAYKVNLGSLVSQWGLFKNAIQAAAIQLGGVLAPAAETALKSVAKLINAFSAHQEIIKFTAYALAAGTALAGTVLTVTAGTLAFIKIQAAIEAAGIAFPAFGAAIELVNAAMASSIGVVSAMTVSIQGLIGATGIGLLLIAVAELALHWHQVWSGMTATFHAFADNISNLAQSLGTILEGALTFNGSELKSGLDQAKAVIAQSFAEIEEKYQELEAQKTAVVQQGADDRTQIRDQENDQHVQGIIQTNQKILDLQSQLQIAGRDANQSDHDIQMQAALEGSTQRLQIKTNERVQEAMIRQGYDLQQDRQDAKNRLQYIKDETKHGKTIANLKAVFRSKEFAATQTALGSLTTLTQSHNKTLFTIGKIAAEANAVINVAQGVTRSLAEYPWPFSLIAAAAQAAAGAVQISTIQSQTMGYAQGGPVFGGIQGIDSVPILAQPGELITPVKNFDETVNAVADKRNLERRGNSEFAGGSEPPQATVIFELKDQLVDFIEAKLIERNRLNIALGSV